jgi:DNA-binding MarR family transcriptional regulator
MSVFSDQIDLAVLNHAVEQYAAELPEELSEALLEGLKAIERREPHAIVELAQQLQQTPALDRIYEKALQDLRQGYSAQERAKSLVLQANQPLAGELQQTVNHLVHTVVNTLEQAIEQKRSISLGSAQLQLLQALDRYPLSVTDLAHTVGLSPSVTHSLIQTLWTQGHIDYLSAALPYKILPFLRVQTYRSQSVSPERFLTLTSKGYFRLYPLFRNPEAPAIA